MSRVPGRPPRYSEADVERMRSMRAAGTPVYRIAEALGTNRCVVRRYLRGEIRHHDAAWIARVHQRKELTA